MSIPEFYYLTLLIFLGAVITSTVLAFVHIFYGSRELRSIRSGDYISPFFSDNNVKILHTILGADSSGVLMFSAIIDAFSFTFYVYELNASAPFNGGFYAYILIVVALNALLALAVSRDLLYNKVSGIRYELKTSTSSKPELDFIPDALFRPLRLLISRNTPSGGLTKVGFVSGNSRRPRKKGHRIEFKESFQLRNQSSSSRKTIASLEVRTPDVSVMQVTPSLPAGIDPQSSVEISVVYSAEVTMKRSVVEVNIVCD
ncbi:MAG: hypothetical protein M1410_07010 [Candidatus Thermoplasmatota archaeon]|nr:hypothetical protein [Candidatus Thermoplasmatota archaeon]